MRSIREIVQHIRRQAERNDPKGHTPRVAENESAKAAMQPTKRYEVQVYVDRVFTYVVVAEDEGAAWVIGSERYNADDGPAKFADHIETLNIKTVVELAPMPQPNSNVVEPALSEPGR